jgi:transcriptional regulator with XRE-family HTH domain
MLAKQPPEEPVEVRVRRRLRQLRSERGLTLAQVAESAAIDVSTLSRLESGGRRLALDHVARLAGALGVSTDQLLGTDSPRDPRVKGKRRSFEGMTMWSLSGERSATGLEAWRITISARRRTPPDPLPVHEGHEWLYVLDGRLRLLLGSEDHTIEPGEAAEFSTWTPHWFGALEGPVELIGLFGPEGQRLHLRG